MKAKGQKLNFQGFSSFIFHPSSFNNAIPYSPRLFPGSACHPDPAALHAETAAQAGAGLLHVPVGAATARPASQRAVAKTQTQSPADFAVTHPGGAGVRACPP